MKNWGLFEWAFERLKTDKNGAVKNCMRNDILIALLNLSGVTPEDVYQVVSNQ